MEEFEEKEKREIEFDDIYFSQIGMCGCGNPNDVKQFLYELLKNHKEYKDEIVTYDVMSERRNQIIKEIAPDIIFEFVFHIMEHNDLIEHGSSVYGSWFTEKGERFFDLLSEQVKEVEE